MAAKRKAAIPRQPRGNPRYEELRVILEQAIMSGELAPGTRLEEQELAERYNVSRTPVRETLRLLASSGLVEMRARQGAVVATLTVPKLLEMFQVMAELEGLCARLAARRISPPYRERLAASHERCAQAALANDAEGFLDANRAFHEAIYAASNNPFLEEMTRSLRNRVAPYRRHVTYQPGRMADSIREHRAVLDAIDGRDAEGAHRVMRDHVNLLGDSFADFISSIPFGAETGARKRLA
jgi:DNA-binding GntR family transcriptional regulator